jgi:hypothetical protein
MRKPEQKQWDAVARTMDRYWDAQRHEDKYSDGIPDVSFAYRGTDGWLELKVIPRFPKNEDHPISIPHLRPAQVNWMEKRARWGNGKVFMLLMVGDQPKDGEWFLVSAMLTNSIYNKILTVKELRKYCPSFNIRELRSYLHRNMIKDI